MSDLELFIIAFMAENPEGVHYLKFMQEVYTLPYFSFTQLHDLFATLLNIDAELIVTLRFTAVQYGHMTYTDTETAIDSTVSAL